MQDKLDLRKLAIVCGRLGSEFDGERAVAAQMATDILRRAGMTWADLFAMVDDEPAPARQSYYRSDPKPSPKPKPKPKPQPKPEPEDALYKRHFKGVSAYWLLAQCSMTNWETILTKEWDLNFFDDLLDRYDQHLTQLALTEKQWVQLLRIAELLGVYSPKTTTP